MNCQPPCQTGMAFLSKINEIWKKNIRHVHVTRQTPTKVKGIYVSHEHKVNDSLTIISKR
jgi:hypothetical protein